MDIAQAEADVAQYESQYRLSGVQLKAENIADQGGVIGVQIEGNWSPSQGVLKSLCKSMGISAPELAKYPIDAQVFMVQAKLREYLDFQGVFYNGAPIAVRGIARSLFPMSAMLKHMKDWQGWEAISVSNDPIHGHLHARVICRDKQWDLNQNDVWFPGIDLFQDYSMGIKLEPRVLLMRQVCANGMVIAYRQASIEKRYDPASEESVKTAVKRMLESYEKVAQVNYDRVKSTADREIKNVISRFPRVSSMLGAKSKEVLDAVSPALKDQMSFYDFHNAYTFGAQRAPEVGETRTIQSRAHRMVAEVADVNMLPYYNALFGELTQN